MSRAIALNSVSDCSIFVSFPDVRNVQAAAVYFLVGLLGYAWRIRWLVILGVRVARGMPGPRARRRALATFAARPATIPPQVKLPGRSYFYCSKDEIQVWNN
jgi:hypothetical protein